MTTLAIMKARIASEIVRDDLTAAIASEITSAINFYRSKRFFFTEQDTVVTFDTVAAQSDYVAAANANIPDLIRIDSISVTSGGSVRGLDLTSELQMQRWLGSTSPLGGEPAWFSYYARRLRLYPKPAGIYPIRIAGVARVAAPASDGEADNAWMLDGEELIRSRAKRNLYANWMEDPQMAQVCAMSEAEALLSLQQETSSRTQVDTIISHDL